MESEEKEKIYISDPNITKGNFSQLLKKWLEAMMSNYNPKLQLIETNEEILEYKYDNSRCLVLDNDIERTRITERKQYKDYEHYLKQLC